MATSKSSVRRSTTHCFPVHFEGGLHSSVRAELVAELMKYILFERQQISMSYDNFKRHSKFLEQQQQEHMDRRPAWSSKQKELKKILDVLDKIDEMSKEIKIAFECCPEIKLAAVLLGPTVEHMDRRPAWSSKQKELKKILEVLDKIDEMSKEIKIAFECCPEIKLAAVLLGPTVVSPREVYKIELPPLNPEADNLPMKNCVKSLFREIILSDPFGNAKQILPTNAVLMLYAPRNSNLSWFCPKPLYKLPTRGEHFYINLVSLCGEGSHELTREFTPAELSGFELLDSSSFDPSSMESSEQTALTSESSSVSSDYVCIDSDIEITADGISAPENNISENVSPTKTLKKSNSASSLLSHSSVMKGSDSFTNSCGMDISEEITSNEVDQGNQYIWFQTPLVIKGFKSKLSKM